jgi:hypothetical protein
VWGFRAECLEEDAAYQDGEEVWTQLAALVDDGAPLPADAAVDAKRAPGAKHTTSRTKLASHAQRVTRRASQFFLKINKR